MKYIFDMDGTLIDNKEAVRQAYLAVGVNMPEAAWGRPWREWLRLPDGRVDEIRHRAKNDVYAVMLQQYATRTPLLERLIKQGQPVNIITGASRDGVTALHSVGLLPASLCTVHATQQNRIGKANWLAHRGWGTFVDDCARTRDYIQEMTTWKVLDPDQALAALSSLLVPTNG